MLRGVAAITLPHSEMNDGFKDAALFKAIGGSASTRLAFGYTEDKIKIFLRILSTRSIIGTQIHIRDQVSYVWLTIHTFWMRSATNCRVIRRTTFSTGRSWFNPHLQRCFAFLQTQEYPLPGVAVFQHRRITMQGVGRGVVSSQGSVIFLYGGDRLWRRFDLARSCVMVQEFDS